MEKPVLLHFGMCVTDLERSLHFYCEALGFEHEQPRTYGRELGRLLELENVALSIKCAFIHRRGVRIELLHFLQPECTLPAQQRRLFGAAGLTHLSLLVPDLDAVVESVERLGGQVLEHTCSQLEFGPGQDFDALFCRDPDGTLIELLSRRGR